jgi:hypothetical protein
MLELINFGIAERAMLFGADQERRVAGDGLLLSDWLRRKIRSRRATVSKMQASMMKQSGSAKREGRAP